MMERQQSLRHRRQVPQPWKLWAAYERLVEARELPASCLCRHTLRIKGGRYFINHVDWSALVALTLCGSLGSYSNCLRLYSCSLMAPFTASGCLAACSRVVLQIYVAHL